MSAPSKGDVVSVAPPRAFSELLESEQSILKLLLAIRGSSLKKKAKLELRDQILDYSAASTEEKAKLAEDISKTLSDNEQDFLSLIGRRLRPEKTKELKGTKGREAAAKPALDSLGRMRPAPSFGVSEAPEPAQTPAPTSTPAAPPEPPKPTPKSETPVAPQPKKDNAMPTSEAPLEAGTAGSSAVSNGEPSVLPETKQPAPPPPEPTKTKAPAQAEAPVAPVTNTAILARINEIKHAVNGKVGNPVNLISHDKAVGQEYMSALLDSMKKVNSGIASEADVAMARLEAAYGKVQELLASGKIVGPPQAAPAPTAKPTPKPKEAPKAAPTPAPTAPPPKPTPKPEPQVATPQPKKDNAMPAGEAPLETGTAGSSAVPNREPVVPKSTQPSPTPSSVASVSDLVKGSDGLDAKLAGMTKAPLQTQKPAETPAPLTPPAPLAQPKPPVPTPAPPATPPAPPAKLEAKPSGIKSLANRLLFRKKKKEEPASQPTPVSKPTSQTPTPQPPVASKPAAVDTNETLVELTPKGKEAKPASATSPAPAKKEPEKIEPTTVRSVATVTTLPEKMSNLEEVLKQEKQEASKPITDLEAPKVTAGLEQLLSEWKLFKNSGFLGTGPGGVEHPLYKQLANLPMASVIAGRFEGVTPEIKQSITAYMNGWRYEHAVVHEMGETFEHYLRRVIKQILEAQGKKEKEEAEEK